MYRTEMTIVLIHLLFSPDVSSELERYREMLFREHGLISARSLPLTAPLQWRSRLTRAHDLDRLRKAEPVTFDLSTAAVSATGRGVFLSPRFTGIDHLMRNLDEKVEDDESRPDPADAPFGVTPGTIPLAFEPLPDDSRGGTTPLPAPRITCKRTAALWLAQSTISWYSTPWFERCTWTVHFRRRLTVRR
jgi:hypothetical protein